MSDIEKESVIECDTIIYTAFASATSYAYTNKGEKVTSSANATASSNKSYKSALKIAKKNAQAIADENAIHDANVINQSVSESSNSLVLLKNLASSSNNYTVPDNTFNFYFKTDNGNSNDLPPLLHPLESSTNNYGTNGSVIAIVFDGSGNMYIGGIFSVVGTIIANNVAKWNIATKTWSNLGYGVNYQCLTLAFDNNGILYGILSFILI